VVRNASANHTERCEDASGSHDVKLLWPLRPFTTTTPTRAKEAESERGRERERESINVNHHSVTLVTMRSELRYIYIYIYVRVLCCVCSVACSNPSRRPVGKIHVATAWEDIIVPLSYIPRKIRAQRKVRVRQRYRG
jgi:hypothetical protein